MISRLSLPYISHRRHKHKAREAASLYDVNEIYLEASIQRHEQLGAHKKEIESTLEDVRELEQTALRVMGKAKAIVSAQRSLVDDFGRIALESRELANQLDLMKLELETTSFDPADLSLLQARVSSLVVLIAAPQQLAVDVERALLHIR